MIRQLLVALLAVGATGCAAARPSPTPEPVEITVYAAASLKVAVERAAAAYAEPKVGTTVTISTDSSAALAAKIQQGAPADVFLSADTANPQRLVDAGFAIGEPLVFAGNELTIVVPLGNPGAVTSAADLARSGLRVVAAGDEVPITTYAAQLLANLAGEPAYPSGFEAAYAANVVSKEENVKAVVAKIELGEGDAAIVYLTDAVASAKVETIDVPAAANVTAPYAGVVVKASAHAVAARDFLDWFAGPDGWAILAELGFLPPSE